MENNSRKSYRVVSVWTSTDVKNAVSPAQSGVVGDSIRIVCISDTHGYQKKYAGFPNGDILIHAGDFTNYGAPKEIAAFANWISSLPHKVKIVIAGNHEYSLDPARKSLHQSTWDDDANDLNPTLEEATSLLKSCCTYLENTMTEVHGMRIYGSPLSVGMGAFGVPRGSKLSKEKAASIPSEIDILVTHGPPAGKLAHDRFGRDMGDEELLSRVLEIKPLLHIFGHIHESYGAFCEDGIHFVNAAIVDRAAPVIIDLESVDTKSRHE